MQKKQGNAVQPTQKNAGESTESHERAKKPESDVNYLNLGKKIR